MTIKYLCLDLYGPLASWGDVAVGQERASNTQPSRSAILGLLGAALGLQRDDPKQQRLFKDYGLAVCVEAAGVPIRDFHTAQVPSATNLKKRPTHTRRDEIQAGGLNTILSQREYQCDAMYRVVLWARPDAAWSLTDLKSALEMPVYVLYLGRKSCPLSLPVRPEILEAESLSDCFSQCFAKREFAVLEQMKLNEIDVFEISWDEDAVVGQYQYQMIVQRRDQPRDRLKWHFSERRVFQARISRDTCSGEL